MAASCDLTPAFSRTPVVTLKEAERILKHLSVRHGIEGALRDMGMGSPMLGQFARDRMRVEINAQTSINSAGEFIAATSPTGFVDRRTIFHEYLHPFVELLHHENPELFNEMREQAVKADNKHGFFPPRVRKAYSRKSYAEEFVVRYMHHLSDQDGVPSLLERFWAWLSEWFHARRAEAGVDLKALSPQTTVQELYEIFKGYGLLGEEAAPVIQRNLITEKLAAKRQILAQFRELFSAEDMTQDDVQAHLQELRAQIAALEEMVSSFSIADGSFELGGQRDSELFGQLQSVAGSRAEAKELYEQVFGEDFLAWFGDWTKGERDRGDRVLHAAFNQEYRQARGRLETLIGDLLQENYAVQRATNEELLARRSSKRNALIDKISQSVRDIQKQFGLETDQALLQEYIAEIELKEGRPGSFMQHVQDIQRTSKALLEAVLPKDELIDTDFSRYAPLRRSVARHAATGEPLLLSPAEGDPVRLLADSPFVGARPYGKGLVFGEASSQALQAGYIRLTNPVRGGQIPAEALKARLQELYGAPLSEQEAGQVERIAASQDMKQATGRLGELLKALDATHGRTLWSYREDVKNPWQLFGYDGIVDGDTWVIFNPYDYWAAWNNEAANVLPVPTPAPDPQDPPSRSEQRLQAIRRKFGAEVRAVNTLPKGVLSRVRAEGGRPVIEVDPEGFSERTLLHEYAHILIDGVGGLDNPQVARGVALLKGTALWERIARRYPDVSASQLAKEVLAEAMATEAEALGLASPGLAEQVKNWLRLLLDRIRRVFGLPADEVRALAGQLISEELPGGFDASRLPGWYQERRDADGQARRKLARKLELYEDTINQMTHRIQSLQRQGSKSAAGRLKAVKNELEKDLKNQVTYSGMIRFLDQAYSDLDELYGRLHNAMGDDSLTAEQLVSIWEAAQAYNTIPQISRTVTADPEMGRALGPEYNQLLDGARHILEDIERIFEEETVEFALDFLSRYARRKRREIEGRYRADWRERHRSNYKGRKAQMRRDMAEWVDQQMQDNRSEVEAEIRSDLRRQLKLAYQDRGAFEGWATAMKNLDDEVLQIVAEAVDEAENAVIQDSFDLERAIQRHTEALREYKGRPADPAELFEDILEVDEFGALTGFIVSEYSSLFEQALQGFYEQHAELKTRDYKAWRIELDRFFLENGRLNPEYTAWKAREQAVEEAAHDEWVAENPPPKKHLPSDRYRNPQYDKLNPEHRSYLGDDHPVVRYYRFLLSRQQAFDEMLPQPSKRLGFQLPVVHKSVLERLWNGDFAGTRKNLAEQFYFTVDEDTEGELHAETDEQGQTVYVRRDAEGNRIQHIPIYYRGDMDPDSQSYDVSTLLLLNGHMSMNYKYKNQILPDLQLVSQRMAKRRVGQFKGGKRLMRTDDPNRPYTVPGEQSKAYRAMEQFLDHRIYGRYTSDKDPLIDYSKGIGAFMQYTGMLLLGGNVLAGVANVAFGETMMAAEAAAGNRIDRQNWRRAQAYYAKRAANGELVGDIGHWRYESVVNLLMKRYDSLNTYAPWSGRLADPNRAARMMQRHHIYAFNNMGEHKMQNTTLLAILDRIKVVDAKGRWLDAQGKPTEDPSEAATLLGAYRAEDGELILDENVKRLEWDGKFWEPGRALQFRITQTVRQINEYMHGAYAGQNSNALERFTLGRLVSMMRGWIEPGIRRRFAGIKGAWHDRGVIRDMGYGRFGPRWDQQMDDFHEGTATTVFRFWKSLRNSDLEFRTALVANWSRMSELERANIWRMVTEFAIGAATYAFAHMMYAIAEDIDDEEEANKYWWVGYQANRLFSEIFFYYPPLSIQEAYRVLKSPAATVSVLERSMRLLWQAGNPTETYASGRREGTLKIKKYALDMVPFYGPVEQVQSMADLVHLVYNQ